MKTLSNGQSLSLGEPCREAIEVNKGEWCLPQKLKHKRWLLRESNPLARRQLQEWDNDDEIERTERQKAYKKVNVCKWNLRIIFSTWHQMLAKSR